MLKSLVRKFRQKLVRIVRFAPLKLFMRMNFRFFDPYGVDRLNEAARTGSKRSIGRTRKGFNSAGPARVDSVLIGTIN